MTDAVLWHRIQFVLTITYHYLFPQLTMGLGLLIVVLKAMALRRRRRQRSRALWGRIFGLTFVMGVVTGIPLEFQIGAGWSRFAQLHRAE